LKITINSVNNEFVKKGTKGYNKAIVAYTYNGEPRTQNIMDFANPSIYKQVQTLAGQEVDVQLTKNAQGYNEWASISDGSAPTGAPASTTGTTRVTGSNYETPEERARKQVYIIKQSSISNAIEYIKLRSDIEHLDVNTVIEVAQQFTDWVLEPKE
jgi:hypothetical protein